MRHFYRCGRTCGRTADTDAAPRGGAPQVQGQERDANEQAAAAKAMADDAQRELDAALPALDAALASLKNLSRWGGRC